MIISLSPTQSQILQALRVNFLQQVLPQGSAMFSGSISGNVMTVTKLTTGLLAVGDMVFGSGVSPQTEVISQLTGSPGGLGTYEVSVPQTVSGVPLNTGVPILKGQGNRVAQPPAMDFVIVTPMGRDRLETNVDDLVDCYFQASIAGSVMAVSEVAYGELIEGAQVFGVGVADGTIINGVPGGGGPGVYSVSVSQTVSEEGMACGTLSMTQNSEWKFQIDCFGPNAADYSQVISTAFRDQYGVTLLQASGLPVAPLYADDPTQGPFVDGEQQYEDRWRLDARLQANQTVVVPQQFADALVVGLIEVEAQYPS
jgi:hypothetical protein